ncbi:dynein axonemal heavy chain 10-like [Carettochelys insculpta]|uniref:dynein axonemal heavy chain 10-like n=1 Tax=Carettochelys insculpta TaxID=44489 RepID=UPI003EC02375
MSHLSAVSDLSELAQGLGGESREQIFKIIKQTVYNLYFHVAFHDISEEFVNDDIMFFLRDTRETVSEPNDVNEANEVLPELLECGILNGHTLLMLKNIFSQVFLPALLYNQHKAEEPAFPPDAEKLDAEDRHLTEAENFEKKKEQPVEFHSFQIIRNEFLMNMQKFLSHIQRTIQQIEGKYLPLPHSHIYIT